jgi:hypothetical protein
MKGARDLETTRVPTTLGSSSRSFRRSVRRRRRPWFCSLGFWFERLR